MLTVAVPELVPEVPVMVTVPEAGAVKTPAPVIVPLLALHVALTATSLTKALNCAVPPAGTLVDPGNTVSPL